MSGVRFEQDGTLAIITLDRPQVSNAVDLPMARSLGDAVERAAEPSVAAVLVTGEGQRFCAGGDLTAILAAAEPVTYIHDLASTLARSLRDLAGLPKPVVAAVHGAVAGAGLAFVLSADVVVAARSTKLLMAYAAVGLTPDCGVSYLLPRAIGQQRALELALTGRVLSADEARDWGLVTEVVDDDRVLERGRGLARQLADGPAYALGQAKRLLRDAWAVGAEDSARDEADTISRAITQARGAGLLARFEPI
jgi:2-(1,2-epoxy-1,2-dihydrophenyl)acetyl-CoA isomerase